MSEQARFEGWAIVDVLGHQRFFGLVSTEVFGTVTMFKVSTPGRDKSERVLPVSEYINHDFGTCPPGTTVARGAKPAEERLIGAGSIYMITPCSEQQALEELNASDPCPIVAVTNADGTLRSSVDYPF